MVQGFFQTSATDPVGVFRIQELKLRPIIVGTLAAALHGPIVKDEHRKALLILQAALNRDPSAKIEFCFEHAMPAHPIYVEKYFREALIRVSGKDGKIKPEILFPALESTSRQDLGREFRRWLIPQQLISFYGDAACPKTDRLSINISPYDVDDADFRQTLKETLQLAHQSGFKNIILEATEYASWCRPMARIEFLKSMQERYGIQLALDDYGDPDAHHTPVDVKELSGNPLTIKMGGKLVENYVTYLNYQDYLKNPDKYAAYLKETGKTEPDKGNDLLLRRLRGVERAAKNCPNPTIVLEWVGKDHAIVDRISAALEQEGLSWAIQLLQDRAFDEKACPVRYAHSRAPDWATHADHDIFNPYQFDI